MKIIRIFIVFAIALLAIGCGTQTQAPTQEPNPTVESTQAPAAEVVSTEIPATATPEMPPEPTQAPAPLILNATVNAATLNMRTGPSILHDILNQYQKDDTVTLIGVAPGNQWVKILTKDNKTGWMLASHLTIDGAVQSLPTLPISESLVAVGKVVDANGTGLPGIQVALTRMGGVEAVRVDGISLADGTVYIYAPIEYQGTWLAGVVGVDCTSQLVDANCRFGGKFSPADGIKLKLPQDTEILFTYQ
jgi:hypothetical protein